jgi:hypothetical protein
LDTGHSAYGWGGPKPGRQLWSAKRQEADIQRGGRAAANGTLPAWLLYLRRDIGGQQSRVGRIGSKLATFNAMGGLNETRIPGRGTVAFKSSHLPKQVSMTPHRHA